MVIGESARCHSCKAIPLEKDSVLETPPRGKKGQLTSQEFFPHTSWSLDSLYSEFYTELYLFVLQCIILPPSAPTWTIAPNSFLMPSLFFLFFFLLYIQFSSVQFSSVQFICSVVFNSLQLHGLQHSRPPCPSATPGIYPNSCPLSQWCHPTISSSVTPFSSCPQSFPASETFQMSQFFTSGGQSIGVLASTSVLPMNTQDWSPLEWTGWISLQSKGLSRLFFNTTVQKHQPGAQPSLWSNSHIHTWLLEKP